MSRRVILVSSHSAPRNLAEVDSLLSAPNAELVAVDPGAYVRSKRARGRAIKVAEVLTRDSLDEIDRATRSRTSSYLRLPVRDAITRSDLGALEARSIFFRLVAFEKSLEVAKAVMRDTQSVELVGDSASKAGAPFPSEFEDLYAILHRLADDRGVDCRRFAESGLPPRPHSSGPRLARAFTRVLYQLRGRRPGRVLTVDLYGDLRKRLSKCLPDATLLPLLPPSTPSPKDRTSAMDLAREFAEGVHRESRGEPSGPVVEMRADCVRDALSKDLPLILARARASGEAISRFRPDVVLMMEDASPAGRAVAVLSRNAGAWTAVIQHGLIGEDLAGTHVMPAVAHLQFAWGDIPAQWNCVHGATPDSQLVVGNPMFDGYFPGGDFAAPDLPPSQVVFASQPFVGVSAHESEFDRLQILEGLLPLEEEGLTVVVKAHPSESAQTLRELVDAVGFRRATWDSALSQTLARPAVFVTKSSTVALEAMILSKPVVLAVFSHRGDVTGLSSRGAALVADTRDQLTDQVRACLFDEGVRRNLSEARKAFLPSYLNGMDGGATRRIALELSRHLSRQREG